MHISSLVEVRRLTEKQRDSWWTVLLVDPVATPMVRWTAMRTRFTPNQVTWGALFFGLSAAACFSRSDWKWLAVGALLYHFSFILDCMDGKLARLTGQGSEFGSWLDNVFDRIRVLACAVALMGGQYVKTEDVSYIYLALAVISLDMLRYVNALQFSKMRHNMRDEIEKRVNAGCPVPVTLDIANGGREKDGTLAAKETIDLQSAFKGRFPWYVRFRNVLLRKRIRHNVVSGVEFQMAVFIIGPLAAAIMPVTIVAGTLLMVFELAIVYTLLRLIRDFERFIVSYPVPAVPERTAHQVPHS
ncbi:CDP-alcohol phosphatidyltransferase family protein [Streptomyces sp. NBC_01643]|uniref:CDP-alcohol phosphatidyltransferase family protein n=1 Tax=Streptomyces sp. NBC_01643 TaxID=2975906 RepID=UPI00386FCB56|nr:CDP-alcohol phosphatidyltransferase family protein [Streptomyces sp. NBC_01643]